MPQNDNNNPQNLNIDDIKQKISEQMPGIDVNNISANDVKNILVNEINNNKNINIDDSIKNMINNGDVDGLKEEIIKYLSRSNDSNSQQIVNMLKNNDMDGLQKQLLGMLLGGMGPQKKNEVRGDGEEGEAKQETPNFAGMDFQSIFGTLADKALNGAADDSRVMLLNSMRPFLSEVRQKSIDDCIRVLNLVVFFEKFTNNIGR